MQAIEVKYLGCTNHKPSRWKASCSAGSITRSYDHALKADDNALAVANELLHKLGWNTQHELRGGTLKSGLRVYVLVAKGTMP